MKILIATDGSDFSKSAIKTAGRIFLKAENARLKIVSVFEPPLIAAPAPYPVASYNPNLEKELREMAEKNVAAAGRLIREQFSDLSTNLETQVLEGSPDQAIVEEAENWEADLIVVGSHGYGFWERVFLGSVSDSVVHHAPCSVLVVRKSDPENGRHLNSESSNKF
jgi:nucleotide-binding universal stress UspA family protein